MLVYSQWKNSKTETQTVSAFRCCAFIAVAIVLSQLLTHTVAFAQNTTIAIPSGSTSVGNISKKTKRNVENSHLSLDAGMGSTYLSDNLSRTTLGTGFLETSGERQFSKYFSAFLTAGAYFASGNGASIYATEATSYQYFAISRASFIAKPVEYFDVELGILGRNFTTLPAAFAAEGFLGVSENINIGDTEGTHLTLQARQQMLTSDADPNTPKSSAMPSLNMVGVDSLLKLKYSQFGISAHYFDFSPLPAVLANQAVGFNQTTTIKGPTNRFAYDFRGLQMGGVIRADLTKRLDVGLKAGFIRNVAASPGTGTGYSLAVGSKIVASPEITIEPEIGYFYNEKNVLPAPFVSNSLGNVNRRAVAGRVGVKFTEEEIEVWGRFIRTVEIEDLPYTADRSIMQVGVSASYDIL